MTLQELKKNILENTLGNDLIIFVAPESRFLVYQYINEIARIKKLTINKIKYLADTISSTLSLVFDYQDQLNVLKTELLPDDDPQYSKRDKNIAIFREFADDYSIFKNCIVICDKVDDSVKDKAKEFIIEIPKLVDWQIKDYISVICPGLNSDEKEWLYNVTGGSIERVDNELSKIKLFSENEQSNIIAEIKNEPITDLYKIGIFDLATSIFNENKSVVVDYLAHMNTCNVEPLILVSLLLKDYKNLLYIRGNSGLSAEDIGVSPKQFNYIKNCGRDISLGKLMKRLDFLSAVDQKLKAGKLDMSQKTFINYLISNLFS